MSRLSEQEFDLPEPPDNAELWWVLPEELRERVSRKFERGVAAEEARARAHVARETQVFHAREKERNRRPPRARKYNSFNEKGARP